MRLASINCTVVTVESSCRKEQKKKKEENEVPGIDPSKYLACRSLLLLLRTTATYQLDLPLMGYMLSCGRNKKTSST